MEMCRWIGIPQNGDGIVDTSRKRSIGKHAIQILFQWLFFDLRNILYNDDTIEELDHN